MLHLVLYPMLYPVHHPHATPHAARMLLASMVPRPHPARYTSLEVQDSVLTSTDEPKHVLGETDPEHVGAPEMRSVRKTNGGVAQKP